MLTYGSLFSGAGGLDLGLERAGMVCKWQVEINEYCRRVLTKHWPDVPKWDDVRTFPPETVEWSYSWRGCPIGPFCPDVRRDVTAERYRVDLIAGGFPCQDISNAGLRAGIEGERSGLWTEFARIIGVVRPRYVLVENVAALLTRGMGRVLADLAAIGFDAEWQCIPAAAVGAPHIRERIFILAHAQYGGIPQRRRTANASQAGHIAGRDARHESQGGAEQETQVASHSHSAGLEIGQVLGRNARPQLAAFKRDCSTGAGVWASEPSVGRVANGVPNRVDRLRALGNAVVPQVAELIGRRIIEANEKE